MFKKNIFKKFKNKLYSIVKNNFVRYTTTNRKNMNCNMENALNEYFNKDNQIVEQIDMTDERNHRPHEPRPLPKVYKFNLRYHRKHVTDDLTICFDGYTYRYNPHHFIYRNGNEYTIISSGVTMKVPAHIIRYIRSKKVTIEYDETYTLPKNVLEELSDPSNNRVLYFKDYTYVHVDDEIIPVDDDYSKIVVTDENNYPDYEITNVPNHIIRSWFTSKTTKSARK